MLVRVQRLVAGPSHRDACGCLRPTSRLHRLRATVATSRRRSRIDTCCRLVWRARGGVSHGSSMPNARYRRPRPRARTRVSWPCPLGGQIGGDRGQVGCTSSRQITRAHLWGIFWVLLSAPIRAGGRVMRNDLISRKVPRCWDPIPFPNASHVMKKRVWSSDCRLSLQDFVKQHVSCSCRCFCVKCER